MILGACSGSQQPKSVAGAGEPAHACGRTKPGTGAKPLGDNRVGSRVALAKLGGKTLAYVADEDDGRLHTVDIETKKELAVTDLDGKPSSVMVADDGRVLVTIADQSRVQVLEPHADAAKPLSERCTVATPTEPVGMAATPDGERVLVTSAWGRSLTIYDARTLKKQRRIQLPREPHAVLVSDDGEKAFVSHVVGGRVSVVKLSSGGTKDISLSTSKQGGSGKFLSKVLPGTSKQPSHFESQGRDGCQGFALAKSAELPGRVLAPQVMVDPGNAEFQTSGYGDGGQVAEVPAVAVIDAAAEQPLEASLEAQLSPGGMLGQRDNAECILPRAAATVPGSRSLLVACAGIDAVVEYDAGSATPHMAEKRRWPVASGPMGIAVQPDGKRAVVWSQFDRELNVIDLGVSAEKQLERSDAGVARLALSREAGSAMSGTLALGRKLFHQVGDHRISSDGRACASCHPGGRDDALTWATPNGPRQTPMLAGRLAKTAPFGWDAKGETVHDHVQQTFQRLRGQGLPRRELDALVSYVEKLEAPRDRGGEHSAALVKKGAEIFFSEEAGCSGCHDGKRFTDRKLYDVKSKANADAQATFDTPSLRFVGGTAPYFHDGRYATLEDVLLGADGTMGHTKHLKADERKALVAFLETL